MKYLNLGDAAEKLQDEIAVHRTEIQRIQAKLRDLEAQLAAILGHTITSDPYKEAIDQWQHDIADNGYWSELYTDARN